MVDSNASAQTISANGMLVYATGGGTYSGRQHLWFDRYGKELGPAGGVVRSGNNFALSPDGKRVVTERTAPEGGRDDLWITDLEHSTDGRFTFDPSINNFPVWSPDGGKVAFGSSRGGSVYNLYQRASNGTGQDQLLLESKENKEPWDWSRDGRYVSFVRFPENAAVFRIRISDRKLEQIVDLKDFTPAGYWGAWLGLNPDDSPLMLRDVGTQDVYSLDWRAAK